MGRKCLSGLVQPGAGDRRADPGGQVDASAAGRAVAGGMQDLQRIAGKVPQVRAHADRFCPTAPAAASRYRRPPGVGRVGHDGPMATIRRLQDPDAPAVAGLIERCLRNVNSRDYPVEIIERTTTSCAGTSRDLHR
jgi:hypothetical protein